MEEEQLFDPETRYRVKALCTFMLCLGAALFVFSESVSARIAAFSFFLFSSGMLIYSFFTLFNEQPETIGLSLFPLVLTVIISNLLLSYGVGFGMVSSVYGVIFQSIFSGVVLSLSSFRLYPWLTNSVRSIATYPVKATYKKLTGS